MARARTRAKRTVYMLLALLLLFLLLQLNLWLPGTWPGGGGGGFRAQGERGVSDPSLPAEREEPPSDATTAPDAVQPPEAAPASWPPKDGVLVELRGPDGELAEGWRLGLGDGGAEDVRPTAGGAARVRDAAAFRQGFRIRSAAGPLRHRLGVDTPAARWSVHLPTGKLPETARRQQLPVRVVDPANGAPIAGAQIEYTVGGKPESIRTDPEGSAKLRVSEDTPFEVRVSKVGRASTTALLSPRESGTPEIALDEETAPTIRYATSPSSVLSARLLDTEGRSRAEGQVSLRGSGTGQAATFRLARASLAGAWLETQVGTSAGVFVFRRPLASVTDVLEIPAARILTVRVRDSAGRPVPGAIVMAESDTYEGPDAEEEPHAAGTKQALRTGPDGSAKLVVAAGARSRILIEAQGAAPMVRALTPLDGSDALEFVTEYAINAPVQVLGADGKPLAGARILARTSMQGVRLMREAVTDANGRALVGGFAQGSIEMFADAPGHAATAQVVDAAPAMPTALLTLARGFPLRVVVADPFGRPIAGVDVELTPSAGGVPLVVMPAAAGHMTNATGTFTLPGVPDGSYDVTLTHSGYGTQKLRAVRPGGVTYFATMMRRP